MGKGSKWRKTDYKKYFENWESIKKTDKETKHIEIEKKKGKTTYRYK